MPKNSILSRILVNVFSEDNPPNAYVVYVMAIYSTMLDSKLQGIQAKECTISMKSPNTYNILIIYLKFLKYTWVSYFLLIIYLNRNISILQVVLLLEIHLQYIYYILKFCPHT